MSVNVHVVIPKKVSLLTKYPVGIVWEFYIYNTCTYSWRNTESENITNPKKYNPQFKLNSTTIFTDLQLSEGTFKYKKSQVE